MAHTRFVRLRVFTAWGLGDNIPKGPYVVRFFLGGIQEFPRSSPQKGTTLEPTL